MKRRGHYEFGGIQPLNKAALVLVMAAMLLNVASHGALPPMVSQIVSVNEPLMDEFGYPLKGNNPSASIFGITPVDGDLVHIYTANSGILPPSTNGSPDPLNVLVRETKIGLGVAPNVTEPGKFNCIVTPRPSGGVKLFVRVFNAPTLEEASFYMDSQEFTVSSIENEEFVAEFSSGIVPLDTNDDDGDGINNAWEKSYGSNPGLLDSDSDGMGDSEEVIAGTDLADSASNFEIFNMLPIGADEIMISWQSERGRTYTLQCIADEVDGEHITSPWNSNNWVAIDKIDGNGTIIERIVPAAEGFTALYRIIVEETPEPL